MEVLAMSLDKWLYNFARRKWVDTLAIGGQSRSIGGNTVYVILSDGTGTVVGTNVQLCYGTTVPTAGSAGFGIGCIFYKTNAAAGASSIYINVGSTTASAFVLLSPVPYVLPTAATKAYANNASPAAADINGLNVINTGAGAAVTLTLPAAATMLGMSFRVQITVAQNVVLSPAATEYVALGGSDVVNKDLTIAGVIGNYADIYCDGAGYNVVSYSGVLTKEA
jgi:hypothetical protein